MLIIKSPEEIEKMARASALVAAALQRVGETVAPGVTTRQLEAVALQVIEKRGSIPAFKGYRGFPGAICVSINQEVVHGIPSDRRLEEGDIVSVDIGVLRDGFYGDAAWTFAVGEVEPETRRLMDVTRESLELGLERACEGNRLSDISSAVQRHVEGAGFSVVRDFVGHGIGKKLHEEPQIPNFGAPGRGIRLKRGMTMAIEPMVNKGSYAVRVLEDGWTAVTADNSLSAHYEHTVAITDDGVRVLSRLD